MKISYLPAVRVNVETKDGKPAFFVLRPYSAIPMEELLPRAEQNEVGSLQELGERYYFGFGVEKDYEKALAYLKKAAELGAQDAQYLAAECFRCGYGTKLDPAEYFTRIQDAAENGSWMAMFNLAAAYREGIEPCDGFGVDADPKKCFDWSLEAEKSIRAYWAFYNARNCVDFVETKSRLLKAYYQAGTQLAAHYAEGLGVTKDLNKALYWLKRTKKFVGTALGKQDVPLIDKQIDEMNARIQAETQNL